MANITKKPTIYDTATNQPCRSQRPTDLASGYILEIATPADEPNQIIEPPKPTAYARKPQSYQPCLSASAVNGMSSNTEDRKPSPSAVCHDAGGNSSTGMNDTLVTSARRKTVPLSVSGMIAQSA